jgi:hypothetical protein
MAEDARRSKGKIETAAQRRERLAAELRSNLRKRKAQAKARAVEDAAQNEAGRIGSGDA